MIRVGFRQIMLDLNPSLDRSLLGGLSNDLWVLNVESSGSVRWRAEGFPQCSIVSLWPFLMWVRTHGGRWTNFHFICSSRGVQG